MKNTFFLIAFVCLSWASIAQHNHSDHDSHKHHKHSGPTFKDKSIGQVYDHYIHLKDALVSSKFAEAQKAAKQLGSALEKKHNIQKLANNVAEASSLDGQRNAFTTLSNELISLVKKSELAQGKVYVEYCPMANKNTGGFWLANENKIANPYFGSMMLTCGSVKETIE